jgi:aspartate aminotransferase-like enzyme
VGLGPRALQRLEEVKAGPMYAQDLRRWLKGWQKNDPPFTPPVSLVRGQLVALRMIEGWGLEKVWARTRRLAEATRAALRAMGLTLISQSPSDSVTGAFYPQGLDDAMRAKVRDRHAVHLAGGQDGRGAKWKTNIFRLNHMGYVDAGDTLAALMAIESEFIAAGVPIQRGAAVAAAVQSLA